MPDTTSEAGTTSSDDERQLPVDPNGKGGSADQPLEQPSAPDDQRLPAGPAGDTFEEQLPFPTVEPSGTTESTDATESAVTGESPSGDMSRDAIDAHHITAPTLAPEATRQRGATSQPQRRRRSSAPVPPGKNQNWRSASSDVKKFNSGDELEYRLARMYFWQGSYARLGIDLQRHFHPDPLLVTDLDLLAYEITSQLDLVKTIGEAKSGTSKTTPKPLDRAIWLGGLMRLVGADRAQLVTALNPSSRVRDVGRTLGVHAISIAEIDRWEANWLNPAIADAGAHGPSAFIAAKEARARCKGHGELERAYWLLRSEVWFLDPWQATNRLIGLLSRLATHWVPGVEDDIAAALRWLYAESLSILSLQLVALTGRSRESDLRHWRQIVADRLAEGSVPAHNMRALADGFDNYLRSVLSHTNASNQLMVESMGAFHPEPPAWVEPFLDLIERFSTSPAVRDLPRYLDLVLHERLVKRRHIHPDALTRLGVSDTEALERDRKLLAAFLRGGVGLPEPVAKAIST